MMQRSHARRSSRRKWVWIIFLGSLTALGGWRGWANHRFRTDSRAYNLAVNLANQQALAQSRQSIERMRPILRSLDETDSSREQVEAALGLPAPFTHSVDEHGKEECLYKDPVTGGYVLLGFHNNRCVRLGGTAYASLPPKPSRDPLFSACERVRSSIAGWNRGIGPLAWLALLALLLVARGYRPIISEAMLAVAILCSVAWLLHPNYPLTPRGIMSNDMLFGAALMLIISAVSLLLTRSYLHQPPPHPECDNCGYNLTGNVSGTCPECGQPVDWTTPAS